MNNFFSNQLSFSGGRLKVFLIPFLVVFIGVSMQYLGFQPLKLVLPIGNRTLDNMASVQPMLERYENTYSLKKSSGFIAQSHANENADYSNARAYAVVDYASGEVITQKNISQPLPMASLTKIMTAIVALDLATTGDVFTVTQEAQDQVPTHIALQKSQQMTLEELLYASLLTSANDATHVIMEGIDEKYGEGIFIRAMNAKAEFLGLENTHFVNPQGFDDQEHYSSVEDLAILSHYALKYYPVFSTIVNKPSYYLDEATSHDGVYLNNWNGLLGVYPNVSGVKIGNTGRAKKTTIVVAEREGKKMLAVLLGAPGVLERDLWTAELLDVGFSEKYNLEPVKITKEELLEKYATWKY